MKKKDFLVSVIAYSSDHCDGWNNGSRIFDDVRMNLERKKEETMRKNYHCGCSDRILAAGGTFYLNHKVSSAVKDGKIIKGGFM